MGVKEDLVVLLDTYLTPANLTRDAGSTSVTFDVLVGDPPTVTVRDMLLSDERHNDLLFTVDDLRAEYKRFIQDVPITEDGRYTIKTWTVAKTGIDGIKLKQKADNEVKAVFEAHHDEQHLVSWERGDRLVGGKWVYSTTFIVAKKVYG